MLHWSPRCNYTRCEAPDMFHSGSDLADSQLRLAPIRDQPPESVPNWDDPGNRPAARHGQPQSVDNRFLQPLRLL